MTHQRLLLKVSGEFLGGEKATGISEQALLEIAEEIKAVHDLGKQVVCVVGAGNIFRGKQSKDEALEDVTADQLGMIATTINALALRDACRKHDLDCEALSANPIHGIIDVYNINKVRRLLEKGVIVICAGGTGSPFFTTDTAAAMRALETNCTIILKGTQVEGVYNKDPKKFADAKMYDTLSMRDALAQGLGVMDETAYTLCKEHKLPVVVFNLHKKGNMTRIAKGEKIGTVLTSD